MYLTDRGKRRLVLLACLIAVAALAVAGGLLLRSSQRHRAADRARETGLALYRQGDYGRALQELSFAASRFNDDVELVTVFAETRSRVEEPNLRHLTSAAGLFNAALRLDPEYLPAMRGLLQVYNDLRWRVEASELADRILSFDDADVLALETRLQVDYLSGDLEESGDTAGAIYFADRLTRVEPANPEWFRFKLGLMSAAGASPEALLESCDSKIREWGPTGDGRFHLVKADLLHQMSRGPESLSEALHAARAGASDAETLRTLCDTIDNLQSVRGTDGRLLVLVPDADGQTLESYLRRSLDSVRDDPEAQEVLVRRLWLRGRPIEALAQYEVARAAVGRDSVELRRWEVLLSILAGDSDRASHALVAYESLIEGLPASEQIEASNWAAAMRVRNRVQDANWATLVSALESAPQDPMVSYSLGSAYEAAEELESAEYWYARAASSEGTWLRAGKAHSELLLRLGRPLDCARVALRLIDRYPNDLALYLILGEAWLELERDNIGIGGLSRTLGVLGPRAFFGNLYEENGRAPEFAPILTEACLLDADQEAAKSIIEQVIEHDQRSAATLVSLARLSLINDLGGVEKLLDEADRLDGRGIDSATVRASLLHAGGDSESGLRLIREVAEESADLDTEMTRRAMLQYAVWAEMPAAAAMMREFLEAPQLEPGAAAWALQQSVTWQDPELARVAIDRLRESMQAGHKAESELRESVRATLAEANWTLRFAANDYEAIAEQTRRVNEVVRASVNGARSTGSLAAITTLVSLLQASETPATGESIRLLRSAISRYPGERELYPPLIGLLQESGDFSTAERYIEAYSRIPSSIDAARMESQMRLAQGDYNAAVQSLMRIVDADEAVVDDRLRLASAQIGAGQLGAAAETLSALLAQRGREWRAWRLLAEVRIAQGRPDEAFGLIERAAQLDDSEAAKLMAADFYVNAGRIDDAERWITSLQAVDHLTPELAILEARCALLEGEVDRASEVIERGLVENPDDESLAAMSITLLIMGESDLDVASSRAVALRDRLPAFADLAELVLESLKSDSTSTDADLRQRSLELAQANPRMTIAWRFAMLLHESAGEFDESIRIARTAMTRNPTSAEAAEWLTSALAEAGRLDEAIDAARAWRRRSAGDSLRPDVALARLQLVTRRPGDAIRTLSTHRARIVASRNRSVDDFFTWITALILNGRAEEAASAMGRNLIERDESRDLWLKAIRSAEPRHAARALAILEESVANAPDKQLGVATEWVLLANRSGQAEYIERAEDLLKHVEQHGSLAWSIRYVRASIADAKRDYALAEDLYRRILVDDPSSIIALNNLAMILVRDEGDLQAAEGLVDDALELVQVETVPHSQLLDTKAQVLLAAGDADSAIAATQEALQISPNSPGLLLTLARAHLDLGDEGAARRALATATRAINDALVPDARLVERLASIRGRLKLSSSQLGRSTDPIPR